MAPMHVVSHKMVAHVMDFHHQILLKLKKFNNFTCFNGILLDMTHSSWSGARWKLY